MSKGLEALQEMRKYGAVMIPNCETIEKELKVLEIIKKCYRLEKTELTQEEYDLLKEIL